MLSGDNTEFNLGVGSDVSITLSCKRYSCFFVFFNGGGGGEEHYKTLL